MAGFNTSFNRPQFQPRANTSNARKNGFDRPITVTGYDLAKGQIFGEHKGVKYAFFVKPEVYNRIQQAIDKNAESNKNSGKEQAPYMGHVIDEKMQKAIPVNSKAVVINSEVTESKSAGGVKLASVERVKRIDSRKSKLLEDRIICVTAKTVKGQLMVAHFLVFEDRGIDINDLPALKVLSDRLDLSSSSYGTTMGIENSKVVRPSVGVRFITHMPTTEYDEYTQSNTGLVINRTYCYDYVPNESTENDEDGQPVKAKGHLLTGAEMMQIRDQYIEFVNTDPGMEELRREVKAINPEWDLRVEIQPYEVYPASANTNNTISIGVQGTPDYEEKNRTIKYRPLWQLSHAKSYLDLDHTDLVVGTNAAFRGTLEVTADKPVEMEDGTYVKMPNNWAKAAYTNGVRGDSLSLIRSATGGKLKPHPRLEIIREQQDAAQAAPAQQSAYAPAQQAAPSRPQAYSAPASSAPAQAPVAQQAPAARQPAPAQESDDFFDIFESEGSETPAAAPSAPTRSPVRFSARK